jgi:hypothetical protein
MELLEWMDNLGEILQFGTAVSKITYSRATWPSPKLLTPCASVSMAPRPWLLSVNIIPQNNLSSSVSPWTQGPYLQWRRVSLHDRSQQKRKGVLFSHCAANFRHGPNVSHAKGAGWLALINRGLSSLDVEVEPPNRDPCGIALWVHAHRANSPACALTGSRQPAFRPSSSWGVPGPSGPEHRPRPAIARP